MNKLAVVIASFERPKLIRQTIESLIANSDFTPEIVVIDDFSQNPEVDKYLQLLVKNSMIKYFRYPFRAPIHTVKNKGEFLADPSEYIHFCDNDIYFEKHWDVRLIQILEAHPEIGVLGGDHHPHHQINETVPYSDTINIVYSNDQPGYTQFMRRADYKKFGPFFSDTPIGGEDSNLCRMAELGGFKIASISPAVVLHCGASGTTGNRAADFPQIMARAIERPEVYVE